MFYTEVRSKHGIASHLPFRPYIGSTVDEVLTWNRRQTVSDSYIMFSVSSLKSSIGLNPIFAEIIQKA
jgi:hypothetical protein